jgi:lipopolysaccharide/colanic/teichoic acid biosynthesis glycosyltransferase
LFGLIPVDPLGRYVKSVTETRDWRTPAVDERAFVRPRRALLAGDVLVACVSLLVMFLILHGSHTVATRTEVTLLLGGLSVLFTMVLQLRAGEYTRRSRLSPYSTAGTLLRDLVIGTACATLLNYLTKGYFTGVTTASRLAVGTLLESFFLLGLVVRVGACVYQRWLFRRGHGLRKALVIGTGRSALDFLGFVHHRPWLGVEIAGRLAYDPESSPSVPAETSLAPRGAAAAAPVSPVDAATSTALEAEEDPPSFRLPITAIPPGLEGLERLDEVLRLTGASEVVVALDPEEHEKLPRVTRLLDLSHVPFKVIPSLFEQTYRSTELLGYAEIPVIDVDVDALDTIARFWKRVLDLVVATGALILLLPLEIAIVSAIALESKFPVIYSAARVGRNGRRFHMHKFRTMVKDADKLLEELQNRNEADGAGRMFKMRDDPRVTRVGAFLRATSLDELPQLINVLRGEMSMVGPRPPLPREVDNYEESHLYRLKAMPGMTGLWQISGRSDLDFEDMVRLDRYYLDNWSLAMDLGILVRTVWVVLTRRGAR